MAAKPRCHTDKDEDDDDNKVYKTKKVLFVDSHGVKNLPYRGRRKHFSCLKQILGGRKDRHNDLFGMAIFQFEREYKACMERRKLNGPQILNILFPIKTDNRYLEYLENTQSQQTDHTSLFSSHEKEVYDNLIRIVGSEMDIRIRQNMFLIKDKIFKKGDKKFTKVSSGSLAEGLDLPGSDLDIMFVVNGVDVIQNVQHNNHSAGHTILLAEYDMEFPGFAKLKWIANRNYENKFIFSECFVKTTNEIFFSNIKVMRKLLDVTNNAKQSAHGPCLSDKRGVFDLAICFHLHSWPRQSEKWLYRHRPGQWPPDILIDDIVNYGCLLVPTGPKEIDNNELLWRISFSMAEKQLSHSMNYTQFLCYALLKLSLKNIIDRNDKVKGLLCSYFMKTAVFWLSEQISTNAFQLQNLFNCYFLCLDKIITWVKYCYCPNYFIPEHNMFRGKINRFNSPLLLKVLERLRNGEREVFTVSALFNSKAMLNESSVKLEMFLYTVITYYDIAVDIEKGCTLLSYIKSLTISQSSSILSGICKYYYAMTSQNIVQKLPFLAANIRNVHVIRRYHKHLHDGTKSDAVTGWLLYASFYYVLGQYNTTLKIIDHVLSRCTPDMISLSSENTTEHIEYYKQNMSCSNITLNEKMRLATLDTVLYLRQSTLIPHELELEVQYDKFHIPPVVMSYCLRFLCYHHLDNFVNRQHALRELHIAIHERYFSYCQTESNAFTILGVCNGIVGDKETAYGCYDTALQNEYRICPSAATRKANLNMT